MNFVAGLLTGLSLIVVIGAQNAYVLRQGIRRSRVVPVVAICAVSDLVLILAGVAGIGVIVDHAGWLLTILRWGGAAFLTCYGLACLRRAASPDALHAAAQAEPATSAWTAVVPALALTWLNPHVYLDTVVLLGSIAQTHGDVGRWWFGAGAATGSLVWFSGLGFGATLLAPVLARPRAWQVLDVAIGLVMLGIAAMLAFGG